MELPAPSALSGESGTVHFFTVERIGIDHIFATACDRVGWCRRGSAGEEIGEVVDRIGDVEGAVIVDVAGIFTGKHDRSDEEIIEQVHDIMLKRIDWFADELESRNSDYMLYYIKNGILKMHIKKS